MLVPGKKYQPAFLQKKMLCEKGCFLTNQASYVTNKNVLNSLQAIKHNIFMSNAAC